MKNIRLYCTRGMASTYDLSVRGFKDIYGYTLYRVEVPVDFIKTKTLCVTSEGKLKELLIREGFKVEVIDPKEVLMRRDVAPIGVIDEIVRMTTTDWFKKISRSLTLVSSGKAFLMETVGLAEILTGEEPVKDEVDGYLMFKNSDGIVNEDKAVKYSIKSLVEAIMADDFRKEVSENE